VMSSCKATESFCFVHTTQYIYEEDNKSALECLGQQATFKFRALWSVRDGKGLNYGMCTGKSFITLHRFIANKHAWLSAVKSVCLNHSNILQLGYIHMPTVLFNQCANEVVCRCVA